jgi:hypothetical protein
MESFIFLFCAFRVPPWKRSLSTSTRNARQNTKSAQRGEVSASTRSLVQQLQDEPRICYPANPKLSV